MLFSVSYIVISIVVGLVVARCFYVFERVGTDPDDLINQMARTDATCYGTIAALFWPFILPVYGLFLCSVLLDIVLRNTIYR